MDSEIKLILAKTFKLETAKINEDSSIDSIESWDSLSHVNLVMALELGFDITFTTDEILDMLNYKIIKNIIETKLNKKN